MRTHHSNSEQIKLDKIVCQVFGLKRKDLHSPSTRRPIVDARLTAIYLQKELLGLSYPQIARHFGKKSHSTCLSAHRTINGLIETNANIASAVADCRNLYGRYVPDKQKQCYNLHFLISQQGIRVSGPSRTIYVPALEYDSLSGILQKRIKRLIENHHYALQLTII